MEQCRQPTQKSGPFRKGSGVDPAQDWARPVPELSQLPSGKEGGNAHLARHGHGHLAGHGHGTPKRGLPGQEGVLDLVSRLGVGVGRMSGHSEWRGGPRREATC